MHTFNFSLSNVGQDHPRGSVTASSKVLGLWSLPAQLPGIYTGSGYSGCHKWHGSDDPRRNDQAEEESPNGSTSYPTRWSLRRGERASWESSSSCFRGSAWGERSRPGTCKQDRKDTRHSSASQRPCRDRVIHLLALEAYRTPAPLVERWCQPKRQELPGAILQQVANQNPRDLWCFERASERLASVQ